VILKELFFSFKPFIMILKINISLY